MTLTEVTIVLAVTLVVVGATLGLVEPARHVLGVQTQIADLYQRERMVSARLHRDISNAGVWAVRGENSRPVRPALWPARFRSAVPFDDAAVTLVTALVLDVPAVTRTSLSGRASLVQIAAGPGCPHGTSACLRPDTTALVVDDGGRSDFVRVTGVDGETVALSSLDGADLAPYGVGAAIVPVEVRSYYFDPGRSQIRYEDGWATDAPVLDDVVDLSFRYFGVPFVGAGGSRLSGSCEDPVAGDVAQPLVELTTQTLADGPWCGGRYPFDADLLRLRRIRVELRLQAAVAEHRGVDTRLFMRPGFAQRFERFVPDVVVQFDVALRNPSLGT